MMGINFTAEEFSPFIWIPFIVLKLHTTDGTISTEQAELLSTELDYRVHIYAAHFPSLIIFRHIHCVSIYIMCSFSSHPIPH